MKSVEGRCLFVGLDEADVFAGAPSPIGEAIVILMLSEQRASVNKGKVAVFAKAK